MLKTLISRNKSAPSDGGVGSQSLATLAQSIKSYNDNVTSNLNFLFNVLKVKGRPDMTPRGVVQEKEVTADRSEGPAARFSSVPVWCVSGNVEPGQATSKVNEVQGISSLSCNKEGTTGDCAGARGRHSGITDFQYGISTPLMDHKLGGPTLDRKRKLGNETQRGGDASFKWSNIEEGDRDMGSVRRGLFGPNLSGVRRDSDYRQGRRDTRDLSGSRNLQIVSFNCGFIDCILLSW